MDELTPLLSPVYREEPVWFTIDVETLADTNFNLRWREKREPDYPALVERWIRFCGETGVRSTCFILGSFAERYPETVRALAGAGHEIASHGMDHRLVYQTPFDQWAANAARSKELLESITGGEVRGYRSASWSLPFEEKYYHALKEAGYAYSSSYFPFKTYLYGQEEDRKHPFAVSTPLGPVGEIPVPKLGVPFSGGFYLRALPMALIRFLKGRLEKRGVKPVVYIHPYELEEEGLWGRYAPHLERDKEAFFAFFSTRPPLRKLRGLA